MKTSLDGQNGAHQVAHAYVKVCASLRRASSRYADAHEERSRRMGLNRASEIAAMLVGLLLLVCCRVCRTWSLSSCVEMPGPSVETVARGAYPCGALVGSRVVLGACATLFQAVWVCVTSAADPWPIEKFSVAGPWLPKAVLIVVHWMLLACCCSVKSCCANANWALTAASA